MLDAHAHVMQVKLCKANTRGVTCRSNSSASVRSVATLATHMILLIRLYSTMFGTVQAGLVSDTTINTPFTSNSTSFMNEVDST